MTKIHVKFYTIPCAHCINHAVNLVAASIRIVRSKCPDRRYPSSQLHIPSHRAGSIMDHTTVWLTRRECALRQGREFMTTNSTPQQRKRKLLIVFGTRPEALKCFPVARAALAHPDLITEICVTAQHRDMVDQVIELTGLPVHHDLNIMQPGQSLFDVTSRVLTGMAGVLEKSMPDIVLVHGDTSTAMVAGLAAFYKRIPVAHVEAGLRSHNIDSPFPEELNRKIVGDLARWHFAPTPEARANLVAEGKNPAHIFVTGNTVIDTLLHFSGTLDDDLPM